jgi:hypothetical protein
LYSEVYLGYIAFMLSGASEVRLSILGRPVVIRAPDRLLAAAVSEAYADGASEEPATGPPIQLEMSVGGETLAGPVRVAVDGSRLRLEGAGLEGAADARTLTASCRIPPVLAARPELLTREVTDTLLLFLLTRSGRVPLHAAGVMCGGTAVLLAGPSGAGKSTLSLAAMTRGLQILSDDTVYIQLQPFFRIWGFPRPLHVFPADAPGFIGETRLRGGKLKAAVPMARGSGLAVADRAAVVLLQRGEAIGLEPVERAVAAAALSRLEPGFDLLAEESAEAIGAVTASGAWRLTLERDPGAAIEVLVERFGGDAGSAPGPID